MNDKARAEISIMTSVGYYEDHSYEPRRFLDLIFEVVEFEGIHGFTALDALDGLIASGHLNMDPDTTAVTLSHKF